MAVLAAPTNLAPTLPLKNLINQNGDSCHPKRENRGQEKSVASAMLLL
jgi:hypothetical protein